jgi:hypothetical protein
MAQPLELRARARFVRDREPPRVRTSAARAHVRSAAPEGVHA